MIVALTGTPGTGKSTVSKQLVDDRYSVLPINEIAKERKLLLDYDSDRQTYEADIDGLNKYLTRYISELNAQHNNEPAPEPQDTIFLEGHLAHHLDMPEIVIILRCHPTVLTQRLSAKGWSENKIRENLEAEAVDVILIECMNRYDEDKIFEIDTTSEKPSESVKRIVEILSGSSKQYQPGKIDWSEEILKWY